MYSHAHKFSKLQKHGYHRMGQNRLMFGAGSPLNKEMMSFFFHQRSWTPKPDYFIIVGRN